MVVDVSIETRFDDGLYDLIKGARLWNKYANTAMRAELIKHHNLRIPKHFQVGAHSIYGYAERKKSTKFKKEEYWKRDANQDLVKSDRMEKETRQQWGVSTRGSFGLPGSGALLQGRLTMTIHDLKMSRKRVGAITPDQIISEIVRTTDQEAQEIGNGYITRIVNQINAYTGPLRFMRKTRTKNPVSGKMQQTVSRTLGSGKLIGPAPGGMFTSGAHGPGF